jgi:hypothetical protein
MWAHLAVTRAPTTEPLALIEAEISTEAEEEEKPQKLKIRLADGKERTIPIQESSQAQSSPQSEGCVGPMVRK